MESLDTSIVKILASASAREVARKKGNAPMAIEPRLEEVINAATDSLKLDIHVSLPAVVVSYDGTSHTCECKAVTDRPIRDSGGNTLFEEIPNFLNVRVSWPRGGGYSLQFPLRAGDHVTLIFPTFDPSAWRTSGKPGFPEFFGIHVLGQPVAIPGDFPQTDPLPAIGDEAVLDGPTQIRLGGPSASFVALAAKVDAMLSTLKSAIASAAMTESGAMGLGGMTALNTVLGSTWPTSTAATKVKGE
jgi:hypothetical protein